MKYIYSDIPESLDVREDLFVRGRLRSGATVQPNQLLLVDGTVEGTVTIEPGGVLVLTGLLAAFIDANRGLLAVSGALSTPLEMVPGDLLLAEGSVGTIDGEFKIATRLGFQAPLDSNVTRRDLTEKVVLKLKRPSMHLAVTMHDAFVRLSEASKA
jgi:hypothetical protein